MNLQFRGGTEKSPVRNHNEDRLWISSDGLACAVLDGCGMWGSAAEAILESLANQPISRLASPESLRSAVHKAEERWLSIAATDRRLRGAATTLDLLVAVEDGVFAAHVGDGRIYRVRGDQFEQVSTDHTWVAEQVARGELTPEEAATDPRANVITRALGLARGTEPEIVHVPLAPGDFVVACTDGIWHQLPMAELSTRLRTMAPEEVVHWALRAATLDNGTIVVGLATD